MLNDLLYNCINSKDIRKYLKELDYQFSPLEAAWLVWQSRTISINEKHKLWHQIIDSMPDCIIKKQLKEHVDILNPSLHGFLNEYMDLQNEYIESFNRDDKNCVYQFELTRSGKGYFNRYNTEAYSTIGKCLARAMAVCAEYTEDEKVLCFWIKKIMIDSKSCYIEARYLPDGTMTEITSYRGYDKRDDIYTVFEEYMCFSFPVPFRKGDILWSPWVKLYTGGPVVLESIAAKSIDGSADIQNLKKIREGYSGDYSDMSICGYFLQENGGRLFRGNTECYMDYEFYPKEKLVGEICRLKLFAEHLRDKDQQG